ncbi:hypothetical protein HDV05_008632, partial [Chytridiales sp. JEL 0842]
QPPPAAAPSAPSLPPLQPPVTEPLNSTPSPTPTSKSIPLTSHPLPASSKAIALYPYTPHFPPTSDDEEEYEQELTLTESETVYILSPDDGSGWAVVQNKEGDVGIVPSTYLGLEGQPRCEREKGRGGGSPPVPTLSRRGSVRSFATVKGVGRDLGTGTLRRDIRPGSEFRSAASVVEIPKGVVEGVASLGVQDHKPGGVYRTVLFDFVENDEGEISVKSGQVVLLLEEDDGSGWVTINDGKKEGLVPASYLGK